MNKWEEILGIKYPECRMTGQCCRMASPSTPAVKMLNKASDGNVTARDFFNIFQPYESLEEARLISPEVVEKSIAQALKSPKFDSADELVFYKCLYIGDDNKCRIHEDRPDICRDYPDTPFLVMPPGCALEQWSKDCKKKYYAMTKELNALKDLKEVLTDEFIPEEEDKHELYKEQFLVSPSITWFY